MTPGTAQNELLSLAVFDNTRSSGPGNDSGVILIAPDGIEWLQITPGENSAGRCSQQNIMKEFSGPTPNAKRNVFPGSPASVWRLLTDTHCKMYNYRRPSHITKSELRSYKLTVKELEAFIAVMYARGVTRKSALPLHDNWTEKWSVPSCKNAMSRNRLCKIF